MEGLEQPCPEQVVYWMHKCTFIGIDRHSWVKLTDVCHVCEELDNSYQ